MKICDINLKSEWLELVPKQANYVSLPYWLINPHCRQRRLVLSFYLNNELKSRWIKGIKQILAREQDDLVSISFNSKEMISVYYVESSGWTFAFKARMKRLNEK